MNNTTADRRVAVLVDCDNTQPEILRYALRIVAQFGRVVLRRAYGNHSTLVNKWQEALVRFAFTPCLQYQYVAGKNTADIALALDALEALFDGRSDTFLLISSDSDFAYLCRKLRERGAMVFTVGEAKTPDALRHASDQFFEWVKPDPAESVFGGGGKPSKVEAHSDLLKASTAKPPPSQQPKFIFETIALLAGDTSEGRVGLGELGQCLKRMDPTFTPKAFGHSGLLDMIQSISGLLLEKESGGYWVSLNDKEISPAASPPSSESQPDA